jgi:hypothetical protein
MGISHFAWPDFRKNFNRMHENEMSSISIGVPTGNSTIKLE